MYRKKIIVSVIIVNYKTEKEVLDCIKSITDSKIKINYEIIVVDNDDKQKGDKFKWKRVEYLYVGENVGYSKANNYGAQKAKGKYLFFLNPDTLIFPNSINNLVKFIDNNKDVGIVAPLLLDKNKEPYPLQGTGELTPINAIFALSFINKYFPSNIISKKYWNKGWDKKNIKEVFVVPGTAFLIKTSIFNKIGKFDERYFLYFEEADLCKRIKLLGLNSYIYPDAKVIHFWGRSAKQKADVKKIFLESRKYYFRKNFGTIQSLIVEEILNFNKFNMLLFLAIIIGAFLRLYKLDTLMPFIGDQAWFYLSARDTLLTGTIPLVGINASYTWLHQGPLWTYILAVILKIFNYNPIAPGYFTCLLDVLMIYLVYRFCSEIFTKNIGLISALFYATSPLVVSFSRMPYHTSLIPLFTLLLLYSINKLIKGNKKYLLCLLSSIAVLYNLELSTTVLAFATFIIFYILIISKRLKINDILDNKNIFLSISSIIFIMSPIILYDFSHNFVQTFKLILWLPYRLLQIMSSYNNFSTKFSDMTVFLSNNLKELIFVINFPISFLILLFGFILVTKYAKKKSEYLALLVLFSTSILVVIINQVTSDAYLPIIFPLTIIIVSVFLNYIYEKSRYVGYVIVLLIIISNVMYLFNNANNENNYKFGIGKKIDISKEIIVQSKGRDYSLFGKGPGSQHKSFTMNYEYLTWLYGNPPSRKTQKLQFIVEENKSQVLLKTLIKN